MPEPQLYDLSADIGQITNLASAHPEVVATMENRLDELVAQPVYQARLYRLIQSSKLRRAAGQSLLLISFLRVKL